MRKPNATTFAIAPALLFSAFGSLMAGENIDMKNESTKRRDDDLRPEYDLARLKGGVRGKVLPSGHGRDEPGAP